MTKSEKRDGRRKEKSKSKSKSVELADREACCQEDDQNRTLKTKKRKPCTETEETPGSGPVVKVKKRPSQSELAEVKNKKKSKKEQVEEHTEKKQKKRKKKSCKSEACWPVLEDYYSWSRMQLPTLSSACQNLQTPVLNTLHRLLAAARVQFRSVVLEYQTANATAPSYPDSNHAVHPNQTSVQPAGLPVPLSSQEPLLTAPALICSHPLLVEHPSLITQGGSFTGCLLQISPNSPYS
ncbi:uncharacterized protein LOC118221427 isoform X2 [Anguilla anguilla]|uniref:uncharacterized protein LOC118221427 isoform X2 n=1 Tax=Anguilla anguilla TaxID=7936 RepID=UPI0015B26547|nr:uncharacterized protein LOC118221427 isoform X2 [Anguilla anguilla]